MGRTHEALERAGRKFRKHKQGLNTDFKKSPAAKRLGLFYSHKPSYSYQEIKTKLITRFPDSPIKTIMITGTARECGASSTAVGFAATLASDNESRVLLVDANLRFPGLYNFFSIKRGKGLSSLFSTNPKAILPLRAAGNDNLYLIPSGDGKAGAMTFFESDRFDVILMKLKEKFDYIILDVPPVIGYDEPKVIGGKTDGVILVTHSGKTRQPVAIRAKKELTESGAKILGVVLNRKKNYIPGWIYRRL